MNRTLKTVITLPALVFVAIGAAWWVAPAIVAEQLGMTLLDGVGRSTQMADLASFFGTLGACMLAGVVTGNRTWLMPAILLLGLAAPGRVHAWLFFDAALAWDMIAVEIVVIGILVYAFTRMEPAEQ